MDWFLYVRDFRHEEVNFHASQYSPEYYKVLKQMGTWVHRLTTVVKGKLVLFFTTVTETSKSIKMACLVKTKLGFKY